MANTPLPTAVPTEILISNQIVPALLVSPVASADEATQVMLRFQGVMSQFLQTQRYVMESYLRGNTPATLPHEGLVNNNGGPQTLLPQQSAPQAEAAISPATLSASPPETKPSPPSDSNEKKSPCTDRGVLTAQLLDLVSKRTGYPTEMLDLDLNMEADLGIDSIKRVEILGGLVSSDSNGWSNGQVEMEKLTSFKRLREIIDYLLLAAEKNGKSEPEKRPAARGADRRGNGAVALTAESIAV